MKIRYLLVFTLALCSCNPSKSNEANAELERLSIENDSLRKALHKLENHKIDLMPYVILKDSVIKNEKSIMSVHLALDYGQIEPEVILADTATNKYSDTIRNKDVWGHHTYELNTSKKGYHVIQGIVKYELNGNKRDYHFEAGYIVK
ncbi:MAG: hypothetical protein Crog3KO_27760 [Crocinitomicaceae bacterium]